MERMQAYARDAEIANLLREEIKTFPNCCMEELKTLHGGVKFEFFATMMDGLKLMSLGASAFGRC